MLLGCIAIDLASAIEMAALLTRSAVGVTIYTSIPKIPDTDADHSLFQILVLDIEALSADTRTAHVYRCVDWLRQAQAQRIALIHPRTLSAKQWSVVNTVADELLSRLHADGISSLCHCKMSDSPALQQAALQLTAIKLEQDVIKSGATAIYAALMDLPSTESVHVLIDCRTDNDYLNGIRGSERTSALCGSPDLALHLPALFRVRGWLPSQRHIERLEINDATHWLEIGQLHSQPLRADVEDNRYLSCDSSTTRCTADIMRWLLTACAGGQNQVIPLRCFTREPDTWSIATLRISTPMNKLQLSCAEIEAGNDWVDKLKLGSDYIANH